MGQSLQQVEAKKMILPPPFPFRTGNQRPKKLRVILQDTQQSASTELERWYLNCLLVFLLLQHNDFTYVSSHSNSIMRQYFEQEN